MCMFSCSVIWGRHVPFNTDIQDFNLKISGDTVSFGLFVGRIVECVGDLNAVLNRQLNRKINAH